MGGSAGIDRVLAVLAEDFLRDVDRVPANSVQRYLNVNVRSSAIILLLGSRTAK